jgi:hypothetical protein
MAWGTYLLRSSFVLVFIRPWVKARLPSRVAIKISREGTRSYAKKRQKTIFLIKSFVGSRGGFSKEPLVAEGKYVGFYYISNKA